MATLSFSLPFASALNGALRRVPVWSVYLAGVLPLAWILWLLAEGGLGIDPVKEIEQRLGKVGLQLIVAGLAVTPLRRFAGLNLLRFRRAIGVLAFCYVVLHLAAWVVLDMALLWSQALGDIVKRPYLTLGMAAFALLVPLAATSNNWALRRLGGMRWRVLHRLVYPAAVLGGVHYLWLVKAWPPEPFVYLGAILALLALRLGR
ncbi:protein-methionine-sulfoxide reductase heme-binding subunit MsrQ [Phaeovulum sp.]|uniref:protein-methionine-sulfoxide reductase heme-binding subunit MsrQ n=1 Tax=Phaeovulum sp. TaxID=2934796 RepID=UPI0027307E8E|nr:protein-methionine-sulfoxide reductase heme-binding subunit MsrQ [Phaeovulum sp.]MDP1668980.1 protein-methionine-sulfoxide reductase heme-binding subunit MsrQ [Phaeovulum sp.]MDZ4119251.1 protein-methionine-sulfoxide reductase heme-binding subunit MsrQ [Phaeovulum sp.]